MQATTTELRPLARSMDSPAPEVSVVIPVFNEEDVLPQLHQRLLGVMERLGSSWEVVLVDDGSRDSSREILERICRRDPRFKLVALARNFGQHPAVFAGFEHSRGLVVVTLDADLQNPPEEIPKLLAKIREGYDVVGGWREERKDSLLRKLPSRVVNLVMARILRCQLNDYGCMLRAYRRKIVRRMCRHKEISSFIPALATAVGGRITEVRVEHDPRAEGVSKYGLLKLLNLNYDLVTGFSTLPLQALTWIGFVFSFLGVGFGCFLAVRRLIVGPEVEGVFTLFAILFFFVGTLYLALGLMGEYVGRIYHEVRARPRFIVDRVICGESDEEPFA